LGGAALWCLLFLNEAQPLRAVTVAADDPENVINEERKFADNGGVNHFTRASYIELRNRGPYCSPPPRATRAAATISARTSR